MQEPSILKMWPHRRDALPCCAQRKLKSAAALRTNTCIDSPVSSKPSLRHWLSATCLLPVAQGTASQQSLVTSPACNSTQPVTMPANQIAYSEKYYDDIYEYRHVILPQDIAQMLPKGRLLAEAEWRALGVQQSRGWVHYSIHKPEPHIMLFRRPKNYGQPGVQMMPNGLGLAV